jgi:lipoyl(octanoyl) transferase
MTIPIQVEVEWLGRVAYDVAWAWQKALVAERSQSPALTDKFLLLEHPPTYTLGRNGRLQNLLLNETELAQQGITFHHVERGGDITYHGPGQLVGYPILNLKRLYAHAGLGYVRKYVHGLEEMLIQVLAEFGLTGQHHAKHRGVWVRTDSGLSKIAAIGVRIGKEGISSHGFALNVNPNLAHFDGIVPCGLAEYGVTSMAELLPEDVEMMAVVDCVTAVFPRIFPVEAKTLAANGFLK